VVDATGGIVIDARRDPLSALDAQLETIRGYQ
jgi:hypothetical protein